MADKSWRTVDPKTGKTLKGARTPKWTFPVGFAVMLTLAAVGWSQWRQFDENKKQSAPPPAPMHEVILRIHGSNTLGASLTPKLARAYLDQLGAEHIEKVPGNSDVVNSYVGHVPGNPRPQVIEIEAHGSSTGFKSLIRRDCDIAASSRRIKDQEIQALGRLGYGLMTSHSNEHVAALDGVAVIVNPKNPIDRLTIDQVAAVFSGEIRNWRHLGGPDAAIALYARDAKSGTWDTFKTLVLGKTRKLSEWALRYENSNQMNQMIMEDPHAIGFIGLPYIRSAKAVSVSDGETHSIQPTYTTVKSESYPLARRLYYYTSEVPDNPHVKAFLNLAMSNEGQKLARTSNLVDLALAPEQESSLLSQTSKRYQELTREAEFVVTIRFESGEESPDSRAQADLKRFLYMMNHPDFRKREIILLGHTDAMGDHEDNMRLSLERANALARILERTGLSVKATHGFGIDVPVAGNDNPEGRRRNRRVEIFLGA